MNKWTLAVSFLFLTACGSEEHTTSPEPSATAGAVKTQPTTGTYTTYEIIYGPVQQTPSDPITWVFIPRARCSQCDMPSAFGVGGAVYVNGVKATTDPDAEFTFSLGDQAGEFTGMGYFNIGELAPGSYNIMAEVAPAEGFSGQVIPLTIPLTVN